MYFRQKYRVQRIQIRKNIIIFDNIYKQKMEDNINLQKLCQKLANNENFIKILVDKINTTYKSTNNCEYLDDMIEQISTLLQQLIEQRLANQMTVLIDDNNKILQEIKFNFDTNIKSHKLIQGGNIVDHSFTEIHNIINQEKKKVFQQMLDPDLEKSLSIAGGYENLAEKVKEIQKKVKGLQDKYETNFKSLWNVLSMTQSAVFDHIKQNRQKTTKRNDQNQEAKPEKRSSFLSAFWRS